MRERNVLRYYAVAAHLLSPAVYSLMLDATPKRCSTDSPRSPHCSGWLQVGMAPCGFARRLAGETVDEAIAAVADLPGKGLHLTLDYLGESVSSAAAASAVAADYVQIIGAIVASGIERNISLKLTQLGLDVDKATAVDNMRRVLEPADANGFFVRIDMENSPYTDATLEILDTLGGRAIATWHRGPVYMKRSPGRTALNGMGARVRLSRRLQGLKKSHTRKGEVDAAIHRADADAADEGTYPAIATHDPN